MFAETLEDIKKAIESIIVSEGMELVDIEYQRGKKRGILKIFIDRKEGGVTLDDCAQISREAGETLEIKELISHSYLLEVSSPGLNRRLKKEEDFVKYQGRLVKIKTFEPINNQKNFKGRLLSCEDGKVKIVDEGKNIYLPISNIARANLEYEFK